MPWCFNLRLRLSPGEERNRGRAHCLLGLKGPDCWTLDLEWSSFSWLLKARRNRAEEDGGASSWRLKVGGGGHGEGECDHFCDTMSDRLKEVEIKSHARVFVELRGEARVRAVYLLF